MVTAKSNAIDSRGASVRIPVSAQVISTLTLFMDSLAIVSSGVVLYGLFVFYSTETVSLYISIICFIWICTILLFQFAGLYEFEVILRPLSYIDKMIIAFVTSFLFLLAIAFSIKISSAVSRGWVIAFGASAVGSLFVFRFAFSRLVLRLSSRGVFTRNIVIIGESEQAARLLKKFGAGNPGFLSLRGIFTDSSGPLSEGIGAARILGSIEDVASYVRATPVDDVIVALPWTEDDRVLSIVERLRELPVNVYIGADLLGYRLDFRAPPSHFGKIPVFEVAGRPLSGWGVAVKGCQDYVLGILMLTFLLPVMAAIAVAIRLEGRGPILFRQKRLGFNNEIFEIYKFRTMRPEAHMWDRTVQASRHDQRVTRVGQFLRRWSLDELPQLVNILNGSMSLVGPRPHAIDHNEAFAHQIRGYFARHRMKPGITGLAQVMGFRGETDTPEKLAGRTRLDVQYTENWSLFLDIKIIMKTLIVCVTGKNAY